MRDLPVVVAGGGPAGAAAALALARGGRRVLLLDASPAGAFRVGEGLPPAARALLREVRVLERFLADGHRPSYGNRSAWGSPGLQGTDFIFHPDGHGWHLDRARFDLMLRGAAAEAGVEVREGARVVRAEPAPGGWHLDVASVEGASGLLCGWVVDATGRGAVVARRHGGERVRHDALVAFWARFRTTSAGDRDGSTLIESAPDGWWYTALVPSGERVVAFLSDRDLADRASLLSPEGFVSLLRGTGHVGAILDAHGYTIHDRPRGADAGSARLGRFVGRGWVAAGDAALSFDPLSSQGILTALYTGLRAGQALDAHLGGDGEALNRYSARLEEVYGAYRRNHGTYYGLEQRWPDRPFWARRGVAAVSAGVR